ncbi:porin [Methylobacterium gossipiicola]|uniref:Porin n=1 Tax=Methylobacterium gossipiicola TaxID=582675 RepID=A0A1I2RQY2_9HYPH|nr:porin [Methylobacterium gossipiicola]SFG43074.1 Porin subfamily protein [Methylobacterium gossipiicola]
MKLSRTSLLAGVVGLMGMPAEAAEGPGERKAGSGEAVRICTPYGKGFFTIPGTETCLRLSGRARFEYAFQNAYSRNSAGDISGYQSRARLNFDARTQTDHGTLRGFTRLDVGSRTGFATMHAGALNRVGNAFPATGIDGFGRVQQQMSLDKAFIQFSGLTAGRASSFFDFYAHDFEFIVASMGSDVPSTNLVAYTASPAKGISATFSVEDPSFRQTAVYASQTLRPLVPSLDGGPALKPVAPLFVGYGADGTPTGVGFVDVAERNRLPDLVGVLRTDGAWGSAQGSVALHEVSPGFLGGDAFRGTHRGAPVDLANARDVGRAPSAYGWAVQGGVKVNLPALAPGDTLYLQGAYGAGAGLYTGLPAYVGPYAQAATAIQGAPFQQFLADAVLNPLTNRFELSTSFSATAALLHYWTPSVRSAVFGSYGRMNFAPGSRAAQGAHFGLTGTGPGTPGTRFFEVSQVLRDSYRFLVGANLIWSPVKEFDIGVEAIYTRYGVQRGRVLDLSRYPSQTAAYVNDPANPVATIASVDAVQIRARVQRDF